MNFYVKHDNTIAFKHPYNLHLFNL